MFVLLRMDRKEAQATSASCESGDHVIESTNRNVINNGICYEYIVGLVRVLLRVGKLAPDEENLIFVERSTFCGEVCFS